MLKIRVTTMAMWVIAIVFSMAMPAMADMYYYRDNAGKLHLTNVFSRIPEVYRARAKKASKPQGPAAKSAPVTQEKVGEIRQSAVAPPTTPEVQRDAATSLHVSPVTTREFGLLSLGMSDFEVLQKLGQPAAVTGIGALAPRFQQPGRVVRVVRGETWYYPGNSTVPPTRLEFGNGSLVHKERLDRY